MASDSVGTKRRLRQLWFQIHKWLGLALAILIIPICVTGSALVWHDWLDETLNPERVVSGAPAQPAAFYADAARKALAPNETLQTLTFPEREGPVIAAASQPPRGGGRPVRVSYYLHPADGRVIDKASTNAGPVRVMHQIHGSLMVPGVGRQIVGWIGVAMLISSLTGLWLWWPFTGGFKTGFRWRRAATTSGNLHHQGGFWIALPLAILSFTGAWISFPAFFSQFSGDPVGGGGGGRGGGGQPVVLVATQLTPDQAVTAATPHATGPLRSISWPNDREGTWAVTYVRDGGTAVVEVADRGGEVTPPEPASPETTARLMRRIHDGTDMGVVWQIIVFLGGLIPAALAVTGILMWFNERKRKAKAARNRLEREEAVA